MAQQGALPRRGDADHVAAEVRRVASFLLDLDGFWQRVHQDGNPHVSRIEQHLVAARDHLDELTADLAL
jgi:hypothetical protein